FLRVTAGVPPCGLLAFSPALESSRLFPPVAIGFAFRIVVWVLCRELGIHGLQPCRQFLRQLLHLLRLGSRKVFGFADIILQVVQFFTVPLVESNQFEVAPPNGAPRPSKLVAVVRVVPEQGPLLW